MSAETLGTLPHWDLSSYYGKKGAPIEEQIHDPHIAEDIEKARRQAESFRTIYKGEPPRAYARGGSLYNYHIFIY